MRIAGAGLEKLSCRNLLLLLLLKLFLPRNILILTFQPELPKPDGKSTGSPTSSFLLAADFRPSSALPGLEMLEPQKLRLSISMQPAKPGDLLRWERCRSFPSYVHVREQSPNDSANGTLHDSSASVVTRRESSSFFLLSSW